MGGRSDDVCGRVYQADQISCTEGRYSNWGYEYLSAPLISIKLTFGGWSLGGQLGIDIGRILAQNSKSRLRVIGVVMIDTLFPYWGPAETVHAEFPVDLVLGNCPPDMKEEILRCTQWSKQDTLEWVDRNWKGKEGLEGIEAEEPPPAVLLYATKYIPVENSRNGAVAMTDYLRHAKGGWDLFPHQFISATWELPAHHFGLFDKNVVSRWLPMLLYLLLNPSQVKETSEKIRRACDLLAED